MDFWERVTQELDGRWTALRSNPGESNAGLTLRDGIVRALGCDHDLGPMAYWEYPQLCDSSREAITRLGGSEIVDMWSNDAGRTWLEIRGVLDNAAPLERQPSDSVVIRPWCTRKLISSARIPFVQVAAVLHYGLRACSDQPLSSTLDYFEIEPTTDPWSMLARVDAEIRYSECPPGTALLAGRLVDVARIRSEELLPIDPLRSGQLISPARVLWYVALGQSTSAVALGDLASAVAPARTGEASRA